MNDAEKSRSFNDLYEFGPFRLERRERRLRKDGVLVVLPPKVFDTLVLLVENAGHIVTKPELMAALWPHTTVEEGNLTRNIWLIRRALGESEGENLFIETVPKAGYRFVAALRPAEPAVPIDPAAPPVPDAAKPAPASNEGSRRASARPRALGIGLAVLLALGIALAVAILRSPARTSPPAAAAARPAVAVLPFGDLSGRTDDGWLSSALAEMISAELAQGNRLRLIPGESIARSGGRPAAPGVLSRETLGKLGRALGADFVLSGSYVAVKSRPEDTIRLDMTLQDASTGETVAEASAAGREGELLSLVASAGDRLRERFGLAAAPTEAPNAVLPRNPEAARFYEEGLAKLRGFDALAAQPLIEASIRAEPDFGPAHGALSRTWSALGYDGKAGAEAAAFFRLAADSPRVVRDDAEARLAETQKNWPRAIGLDAANFRSHPDDPEAGLRLAQAQIAGGQPREAISTLAAIAALRSPIGGDPRIDLARADALGALSRWKDERAAAERAAERALANGSELLGAEALLRVGSASRALGDNAEARRSCETAAGLFRRAGDSNGEAEALIEIANVASDAGDEDDYRDTLRRAQATFARIGNRKGEAKALSDLAVQDWFRGDADAALRETGQVLAIDRDIDDPAGIVWGLNASGNILADQGRFDLALARQEEAAGICRKIGDDGCLAFSLASAGDTFLAEGRLGEARRNYEDALALSTKLGDAGARATHENDLGNVFATSGETAKAERSYRSALAERRRLDDREAVAETEMLLAEVENDQGRFAEAERMASDAARMFGELRQSANHAVALADLSRADLGLGKIAPARSSSDEARALLRNNRQNGANLPVVREALRVETESSNLERARTLLAELETRARDSGWLVYVLEAREARAELEVHSGETREGLERARKLAEDARAEGIGRVETEARNLIARSSGTKGARSR